MNRVTKQEVREHIEENYGGRRKRVTVHDLSSDLDYHYFKAGEDIRRALESLYQDGFLEATFRVLCPCQSSLTAHLKTRADARIAQEYETFCMSCYREELRRSDKKIVPSFFVEIPDIVKDHIQEYDSDRGV